VRFMTNPFRLNSQTTQTVKPCVVVIFGATGDLTHRKLVPALYNLSVDGLLPTNFSLVGFARRDWTDDSFRESLRDGVSQFSRRKPLDESIWSEFSKHSCFVSSAFDSPEGYKELKRKLEEIDLVSGVSCNRIFYLATSPEYFEIIAKQLNQAGLLSVLSDTGAQSRVIVEKPFGHDLESAEKLNKALLESMREDQIFRIDHYLGKETVQNLLVFRFSNGIFEPIWNHKYIDHLEISVCEAIGVGSRAGYFDKMGILRDIVQNHALQLLCLVALEPPVAFEADAVRDEKVKVLRSLRRYSQDDVRNKVIRARYQSGAVEGKEVVGYLGESGVDSRSTTETYVALELSIDNWRWAGVPIFLRAGKRMAKRMTEISIHFKSVPHRLFEGEDVKNVKPNILSFQIQPDEGISFKISSKPPGPKVRVQQVNMDFSYGASFGVEPPEAYERLLLDGMRGDATLFTRNDEIEEAWELLQPIFDAWKQPEASAPPVYGYEAGSWGPKVSDDLLLQKVGRPWRRL
jgi:glucose-6-phosphate 1-dehydrogenase